MRTNFVLKTPKAMALSYFNDTFINDMWTMQERKQQCYQLVTSYIATKNLMTGQRITGSMLLEKFSK